MSKRFLLSLAVIALAGEAFASGMPPQVTVTSSPVGTQINTLPSSNPAGTSDTVAFPFQGVTGGVPVAVQSGSVVTGQASLTVGSSTGNVALGSAGPVVQVYNPGSAVVYVKLGNNAVTAASTDTPVAPGSYLILNTGGVATYIAAIAPTGTPTLTITTGAGTPLGWGGSGGGGSGGGTSSSFGSAFPATGTAIGVSNGTNMVALTLGQTTMSASVPVALASNQSAIPVSQGAAAGSGPWITTPWIAGAVNSSTNGTYSNLVQGNVLLGATNGLYSNILQGNAVLSASNPIFTTGSIGGAAISATNGGYVNLLQGNAVNASGNPIFVKQTADTTTIAGSAPGTAGSASANVLTAQGIASMTPFLVNQGTASLWNTTWAGGTLGAMANYGTSPGTVLVPGMNAFVTNGINGFANGGSFSGSNVGVVGGVYNTSAPTPSNGQVESLQLDASGNLKTTLGATGYNSNFTVTPTVTAGTYSANQSLGGLQTVSVFRTTGQPSGILNYISIASKGGITASETIWAFNKSPASTCTDKSGFTLSTADLALLVPGFPIVLTPVASNGQTPTTAAQPIVTSVLNKDSGTTANLYFCIVTNGTPTPGSTTDIIFGGSILQD